MQMVISCSTTHYQCIFRLFGRALCQNFSRSVNLCKSWIKVALILSVLMSNFPKPECIPRLRFRPFIQLATQKNVRKAFQNLTKRFLFPSTWKAKVQRSFDKSNYFYNWRLQNYPPMICPGFTPKRCVTDQNFFCNFCCPTKNRGPHVFSFFDWCLRL